MSETGKTALTRREFIQVGSGALLSTVVPAGCGGDDGKGSGAGTAQEDKGTPWAGSTKMVDLMDKVHLADIYHYGEFVDFGTAARFKYTLGGWMSGFDGDMSMNGMTYTWASKSPSRFYFSVQKSEPLTFVIRAKKGGVGVFSAYLNDKPLSRVSFKSNDWEEHRVEAPAETVLVGENYLKLVFQTSDRKVGGIPASFAVDYIRIIPEGADITTGSSFDPPRLTGIRQHYKAGDEEREALLLPLPTTLSYYTEIPASGKLCYAASVAPAHGGVKKIPEASVKIRVRPVDGSQPSELLSKSYAGGSWQSEMVDLGKMAGKMVRLDLIASGSAEGRLALNNLALRAVPPQVEVKQRKRNAIVVLIDTLRADKLTAYAKTRVKTPAFGKFVKEATLFERCLATSNWTKPSCATVLTGLYPDTHKARGHSSRVASSVKLASEVFRAAGFATGAFIANGYLAGEFGFNRGWTKYTNFIRENKNTEAKNVYKETLDFIAANKEKPFFTYVQTIDPHVPYDPPDEDLKLYDARGYDGPVQNRRTGNLLEEFKRKKIELSTRDRFRLEALYDGEVTYHDRHFGHFLDGLKKLGVLDDTAIVVCADHGEEFFDHESVGHGHTLHQELLHVPLVIRAPGVTPANKRLTEDVSLADILPTVLGLTGTEPPKNLEGRDLLATCNGALPDPLGASFASFYSEADKRNLAWAVRKGDFKLRMKGPAVTYLYDLANDPKERADVDVRFPLALRALRIALGQFIGAPDKRNWNGSEIALHVVTKKAQQEQVEVPEDLKNQLRALGYMQ